MILILRITITKLRFMKCLLKLLSEDEAASHLLHLLGFSLLCVFKCILKWTAQEAKSHRLHSFDFSTVRFKMSLQIACLRRGKVTLVAFVWLFSTVCFQMCPQIACLRRGKVTLVAFVQLFSAVCFQMSPQVACLRRGIATLVALVWLFSTVRLKMFLRRCNVTLHPLTKCLFRRLSSPLFSGLSFHKTKSCYLRPNISDRFPSHFIHIQIFVSKKKHVFVKHPSVTISAIMQVFLGTFESA